MSQPANHLSPLPLMWKQHSTTSMKTQRIETFLNHVKESAFSGYMCGRGREKCTWGWFHGFQKEHEIHRVSNHMPRISWTAFESNDLPRCNRIPTTKDLFQPMLRNFQMVKTVSTSAFPSEVSSVFTSRCLGQNYTHPYKSNSKVSKSQNVKSHLESPCHTSWDM